MSSTFEDLPDEILIIIFQYSGDVLTIFRTYLGLNQRLNNILIDKRLHLLTDLLYINRRDDYYNSEIFQQVSQQLLCINTSVNEKTLSQFLQPILSYHIQRKYVEFGDELHSSLAKIRSLREQLTSNEFFNRNQDLKRQFNNLEYTTLTAGQIKSIKSLVFTEGARLECEDYELGEYNLTKNVSDQLLTYISDYNVKRPLPFNSYFQLYKTLIISNPLLIKNREYLGNGGINLQTFLIDTLYRLQHFNHSRRYSMPVNMNCYRAIIDLCLFVLQCWKEIPGYEREIKHNMFDALETTSNVNEDIFICTAQWEIRKIIMDKYIGKGCEQWDDFDNERFNRIFKDSIENHRPDVIKYVYQHFKFQKFFVDQNYIRQSINVMTANQLRRQFWSKMIDDESLAFVFPKKDFLFILLDKKERNLLEKLIKSSPDLIHELDKDGNDSLLYISLKVRGLRHRIIESLIKMGSDLQRRNSQGQNFEDTLQLPRNKKLSQKLYEYEIYASSSILRDTT